MRNSRAAGRSTPAAAPVSWAGAATAHELPHHAGEVLALLGCDVCVVADEQAVGVNPVGARQAASAEPVGPQTKARLEGHVRAGDGTRLDAARLEEGHHLGPPEGGRAADHEREAEGAVPRSLPFLLEGEE